MQWMLELSLIMAKVPCQSYSQDNNGVARGVELRGAIHYAGYLHRRLLSTVPGRGVEIYYPG
jgi:hypothetical protein